METLPQETSLNSVSITQNYKGLDVVRGLSAYVVFFSHIHQILIAPVYYNKHIATLISVSSHYAVIAFFILSGFLIVESILRNGKKFNGFNLQQYIFDRVVRIYPPLILSILIVGLIYFIMDAFNMHGLESYSLPTDVGPLARDKFDYSLNEIRDTLTATQAYYKGMYMSINGPLWSLMLEIGFYILAAFAAASFLSKKLQNRILGLIATTLFLLISLKENKYSFYAFFFIWLIGGLIALSYKKFGNQRTLKYIGLTSAVLIVLQIIFFGRSALTTNTEWPRLILQIPYSFLIAYLIFAYQIKRIQKFSKLEVFFKDASKYSYTLYICHFPMLLFVFTLTHKLVATQGKGIYFFSITLGSFLVALITNLLSRIVENKKLLMEWFRILTPFLKQKTRLEIKEY